MCKSSLTGSGGNGPGSGFKNNLMLGPGGPHPTPASDPNYAQQFHNFQQQLYATNTRNNQMGQNNGPPPGALGAQGKFKVKISWFLCQIQSQSYK